MIVYGAYNYYRSQGSCSQNFHLNSMDNLQIRFDHNNNCYSTLGL